MQNKMWFRLDVKFPFDSSIIKYERYPSVSDVSLRKKTVRLVFSKQPQPRHRVFLVLIFWLVFESMILFVTLSNYWISKGGQRNFNWLKSNCVFVESLSTMHFASVRKPLVRERSEGTCSCPKWLHSNSRFSGYRMNLVKILAFCIS